MKGGYALDARANGFGLIELAYHAAASYTDPLTDNLYLVLDENNEPTDAALPLPATDPDSDDLGGSTIFQFDGDETSGMVFLWRGRLNLLSLPAVFNFARTRCGDYANLVLRVYGDGVLIDSFRVLDRKPVKLPSLDTYETYEIELVGTSRVRGNELVSDPEELT